MSSQAASIAANPAISQPRLLLHLEGLAIFIGAVALYWTEGFSGWLFALLLFAPDLSMVGYLKNPQIGATVYNAIHTFVTAGILLGMGWSLENRPTTPIGPHFGSTHCHRPDTRLRSQICHRV